MPPVRSIPMIKPIKTERSHEENQERAYIAASRRSDRSLEARVESARRASEIHKRRTGRSLRVREEDVLNEEMYEEEDDDVPSQLRRLNALQGLTGPFSDRLQSSLAMQLGMRDALTQALLRNQQYQNATANAAADSQSTAFMSPLMPHHAVNGNIMSTQGASNAYMSSPAWLANAQQNRSASMSAMPDQQQMHSGQPPLKDFNLHLDSRKMSMPAQFMNVQSPSGSHPPTPHGLTTDSPQQQVLTPPRSVSAQTPTLTAAAIDSPQNQRASLSQRRPSDNLSNPLSIQLPQETQQMLGFGGQGFNSAFFSQDPLKTPGGNFYDFQQKGASMPQPTQDLKRGGMQNTNFGGLNQTISPSALYNLDAPGFAPSSNAIFADLPSSAFGGGADAGFAGMMNFGDDYNSLSLGEFGDECHNGAELSWNPEDFVNFGPPT